MFAKFLNKFFPDSWLTGFWNNPRKRALVLLPFWIAFIVFVFAYYIVPYNRSMAKKNANNTVNNTVSDNVISKDLEKLWQNILDKDYQFKFIKYLEEDNMITYEGSTSKNIISGIKKEGTEEIEFYIDKPNIYLGNIDNPSYYGSLEEIDYDNFLNPIFVHDFINDISYDQDEGRYIYEKDGICVIIFTVGDYINSIEISSLESKYILNFMRIN